MFFRTKQDSRGFTMIELLVVVAIIALLTSVIMVSLGQSRTKSRDARRLADMRQVKNALELYLNSGQGYPDTGVWDALQPTNGWLSCNGTSVIMVPDDTQPGFTYDYTAGGTPISGCGGQVWSNFKLAFTLELDSELGPAGTYYLTPNGFSATAPF